MKKQILTMFTGLFIGAIITGGASAYAAGILAERSSHRIFVDGQEVQMEAYGIAGHNYVKLRDIGKAVGFNVFWDADSGCVQIDAIIFNSNRGPFIGKQNPPFQNPERSERRVFFI